MILLAYVFSTAIMKSGVRGFSTLSFFIMAVGALLVGVGYSMNSVAVIAIGGFLMRNFLQALQIGVFQTIAKWFRQTRGFVLGLMGAAFALDNSTASSGLTVLYNSFGFNGMMIIAAVILAVLGVLTFLFVRTTPEEVNLTVDGLAGATQDKDASKQQESSRWTLGGLLKLKESWCIIIGIGVFNMTLAAVISQFFNSMLGMGVELPTCMTYMIIFGLLGIAMSPIYGKMVDKLGAPATGVVVGILYCISVAGFCFRLPIVGALGLTFFVGAPILQPALTMHVFGGREYQGANRYLQVLVNIIGACGIPFMTIFKDMTGSYTTAYYVLLAMNFIVVVLMLTCRKTYAED